MREGLTYASKHEQLARLRVHGRRIKVVLLAEEEKGPKAAPDTKYQLSSYIS